jgi:hypothetical protein
MVGLGAEGEVTSQSGLFALAGVLGPVFLDVEVTVDQAVPELAGVGAVHRDDSVADLPGGVGVLTPDPGAGLAFLLLSGLVEDQYRAGGGEVTYGVAAYRAKGGILVPDCLVEQALQSEGARLSSVLGDRPAILARQISQQATQVIQGVSPGLAAGEERGEIAASSSNFSWNSEGSMLTAEAA